MKFNLTILFVTLTFITYGQGNGLYKFIGANGKYGFINKLGEVKVKPEYLIVTEFSDGLCFVSKTIIPKGYKWLCIDTSGKEVFDIDDNFPETGFSEGFARISSFKEHWFINKKGKKAFTATWKDGQGNFRNGVAYVSDVQFSDFYPINTEGQRIGSTTYSRIQVNGLLDGTRHERSDTNALIPFKQDSLWGFKNKNGAVVIAPRFFKVDNFERGLCAVRLQYKRYEVANDNYFDAIINTKGEVVTNQPMHCYLGFQGDLIVYYGGFHFSGGVFYLDSNGQRIVPKE